ncbi:MAG: ATPase [Spirochaetaceae bacterium]|jgi:vacuolar-type H+-ATPase subunit E/Vma4|nr:ATPase [Spirochaetaceae bacterium]
MEELQSTEVLDREILEDARRKAQRILKAAGDEAAQADQAWEQRGNEALEELRQRHAARLEKARQEILARLPLDKRRARLERIDGLLREAGRRYLEGLDRARALGLLERELRLRAGALLPEEGETGDGPLRVRCRRSMTEEEVRGIVEPLLPGRRLILEEEASGPDQTGGFPALSIDSGAVRVSVSAEATVEALLETRRGELASALLGGGSPDA